MLSLWFAVFWFISAGANAIRPSALQRGHAFLWMWTIGWLILVATTVYEDRFHVAGLYFLVVLQSAVFVAAVISLCELFAAPTKSEYARFAQGEQQSRDNYDSMPNSDALMAPTEDEEVNEEANETTPLVRGDGQRSSVATSFANYANHHRRSLAAVANGAVDGVDDFDDRHTAYGKEQKWSGRMPTWTWVIQFLLVAPINLILAGQIGLLVSFSISQTGADGSPTLTTYLIIAFFSILVLLPLGPFMHRFTPHIPAFLALAFIGTLIYNLTAFPFSAENRYKVYFQQSVDLETGQNMVTLVGLEEYVRSIIAAIPSAAGQSIECTYRDEIRTGLSFCSWEGIAPKVVPNIPDGVPPENGFSDWLTADVIRIPGQNAARFTLSGQNTRSCVIHFERPIRDFNVLGSGRDDRFDAVPETGSNQIKLWHREWDMPWTVDVEWPVGEGKKPGEEGMEGRAVCLWADDNVEGVIPALDEVRRFMPTWAAVSKLSDGLVEGSKPFII